MVGPSAGSVWKEVILSRDMLHIEAGFFDSINPTALSSGQPTLYFVTPSRRQ